MAFGTDAAGGIINFVLRRKLAEPLIELGYGSAAGGAQQRRGTLHMGIDGDRLDGIAVVDYNDQAGLLGAKRERWRNQAPVHLGGIDLQSLFSPHGNIASVDGHDLPGLNAPIAGVPLVDATPGISTRISQQPQASRIKKASCRITRSFRKR